MHSRVATLDDAAAIVGIYNQGIEDRVGTFETEPRTAALVQTWFDGQHPIVVVEHQDKVIAYASSSAYRPRLVCRDCGAFGLRSAGLARERRWSAGALAIDSGMRASRLLEARVSHLCRKCRQPGLASGCRLP